MKSQKKEKLILITYLVETSGEYANFEKINAEIQALLDEIASIKTRNINIK